MATNQVYSDIESERRPAIVGSKVAPGTPLIVGGRPVVTLTGSGDYDGNAIELVANGVTTVLAGGRGGVGLQDEEATVTPTGSWAFDVAGASASTDRGDAVYITPTGTLSLTSSGNKKFGIVEFFRGEMSATDTVVTIGVNLG